MVLGLIVNNGFLAFILGYFNKEYITLLNLKFLNKFLWKRNKVNRITLCRSFLDLNNFRLAHIITTLDFIRLYIKTLGRKSRKAYYSLEKIENIEVE